MKKIKKIALIIAVLMLMAVCFVFGASALEPTGQCGDNVYWDFDSATGELVISGNGPMYDFESLSSPFYEESDIKKVVIEENVTTVGDFAFRYCKEISDLTLGNSIVCIGDHSFACCDALINVDIPDSVTTIKELAFFNSKNLSSVKIGKEVAVIEFNVFAFCYRLAEFSVHKDNANYSTDENGVLFNKDKTVLIKFPEGSSLEHYKIPDGVTTIDHVAFLVCNKLTNISIPSTVTTIGGYSFFSCLSLDNIILPDSITCIWEGAFAVLPFCDKIYIEGLSTDIQTYALGYSDWVISGISQEEFVEKYRTYLQTNDKEIEKELEKYISYPDEPVLIGTLYCHSGSTAETYAIENNMAYELIHFFKGEWTYDYDNMIRTRKCIHCDELQVEELEIEELSGDNFLLVEEKVTSGIEGEVEVLKVFDINLKNSDGVHVQPDGTIKVKLPNDWSKSGVYKVYRVNDDGTLTDMNAYREGSHLVFDTDHFSIYVIVVEGATEEEPETPDTPADPETPDCDCFCHAEGVLNRILVFVYKLIIRILGTSPLCECGIAHY